MMTLLNILNKLKRFHRGNYRQFSLCFSLSVALVSALTMFILSPFVQGRLPEGGDSRKMLYMVYAAAVAGCVLFTVYAAALFLRFKSREVGILMALGTKRSILAGTLMKELLLLSCKLTAIGIGIGGIAAYVFGKLYESLIQSVEGDHFGLSFSGLLVSVLFTALEIGVIMVMAVRFMRRADLVEILNEERRTEPIRKQVDRRYLTAGMIWIAAGLSGGLILPAVVGTVFKMRLGGYTYAFYFLVFVGLYRMMVYSVAVHKRGKHPRKYYKHLISFGMMKFQGVSVVRNMLIIALLLAGTLYAVFYSGANYIQGAYAADSEANDISYRYLGNADGLGEEDVKRIASGYGVEIADYREAEFIRLLSSGISRENYDEDGKLIEEYREKDFYKNFISAGEFTRVTGMEVSVRPGMYRYISRENNTENYWFLPEDLDLAENTDTGVRMKLACAGTVRYSSFFYNRGGDGNASYILNDDDFALLREGLSNDFRMTHILFNVSEAGDAYGFAKELYAQYCNSVPDRMRVMGYYDEYREEADEEYDYSKPVTLYPNRPEIEIDWKYAPVLVPLLEKSFITGYATLLLIFMFVAAVCLAAAGVIGYTRSMTVALKSKGVLTDMKKLGAGQEYLNQILKEQVRKVFVLPTAAAVILMFVYYTLTLWQNDGVITANEYPVAAFNAGVCAALSVCQYILYRCSLKKASRMIFD